MTEAKKRVIVIGSEGHYGVDGASWITDTMPNIADYATVIIDTSSFDSILEQARTDKAPEKRMKNCLGKSVII